MSLEILPTAEQAFLQKRFGIVGVVGPRESGKSTYMVKKLVQAAITKKYRKVFCNLHIGLKSDKEGLHYGPPGVQFVTYEEFMKIREPAPNGVPSALVGIDQIHRWLDARSSNSKHNIETTDHIVQSRQHGFDILTTTWARSFVDLRLRRFYELLIEARRGSDRFYYDFTDPDVGTISRNRWITLDQARDIWKYFNTSEEILPPVVLKEKKK